MAEYESRKIRGWRGLLDDAIAEVRLRFWNAPAKVLYSRELGCPGSENLAGNPRWFNRVFGPEREDSAAELSQLQKEKRHRQYKELTHADKQEIRAKTKARRSAHTEAEREHERAMCRQRRANQGIEWKANEAGKKRQRRLAKPDLYREIDRRSKVRTKDASNARKRARYTAQKRITQAPTSDDQPEGSARPSEHSGALHSPKP